MSTSAGERKTSIRLFSMLLFMLGLTVGCGGGVGGNGESAGPTDFTAPSVTAMSPAEDSFEIPTNTKLTATLSERMAPSLINSDKFRLAHEDISIPGTVSYDTINKIAVFTPTNALTPNTRYTATVVTGIQDLSGNTLNRDFAWCFTTAATGDSSAPSITAFIPNNAATDVAVNRKLSVTFSEEMNSFTLTPANFRVIGPGASPVSGAVAYLNRTAVFRPHQLLAPNSTYSATVSANVMDLAGNNLAADTSWSFSTGSGSDAAAPVVLSTSPAHNETGVAISRTINVTFNELMDPTTVTTENFLVSAAGMAVVGTVEFDANTNSAIFTSITHLTSPVISHPTPVTNLQPNTTYTVTLTTGVRDLARNPLATNKVWSFTTGS